jgi:hypothetical protein
MSQKSLNFQNLSFESPRCKEDAEAFFAAGPKLMALLLP